MFKHRTIALVSLSAVSAGCGPDGPPPSVVAVDDADDDADDAAGSPGVDCDPLRQDCPSGRACTLVGNSLQCVAVVVDGVAGDRCLEATECGLGLACLAAAVVPDCESSRCCTPLCAIDGAGFTCPGAELGAVCAPALTGAVREAHRNFGVCRLE